MICPKNDGRNNIEILPLYVVKDGASYRDGLEITPQDIFDFVAQGNDPCKTASVSEADYADCFSRLSSQYDAAHPYQHQRRIFQLLSKCMSGSAAVSQRLSSGFPQSFHWQRPCGDGGGPPGEHGTGCGGYCPAASGIGWPGRGQLLIDSLEYLYKGGRCSSLRRWEPICCI